jgi:prepilin-type N-terminal cleavage/methylation domain-containing protein
MHRNRGFTLLELLIVVGILLIVATIAVHKFIEVAPVRG